MAQTIDFSLSTQAKPKHLSRAYQSLVFAATTGSGFGAFSIKISYVIAAITDLDYDWLSLKRN